MSDPGTRFDDHLPCGCSFESGTWFLCAEHQQQENIDREASKIDAAYDRARDEGLV